MKLPVLRHEEEFGKDGSIYDKGSSSTTPNNRPSTTSCLFRSNFVLTWICGSQGMIAIKVHVI